MSNAETENKRVVKLQFHYIKSPGYRETVCHGAFGGITAQSKIWMAIFSERGAIPRTVEFDVEAPEGSDTIAFNESTAVPSHVDARQGIIRHVEFCTYMDLDMAVRLHGWLSQRITELQGHPDAKSREGGEQ